MLCIVTISLLRLNHVAAQITNWTAYPGLFLLFVPHMRLGEFICRATTMPVSFYFIKTVAAQGFFVFIKTFGSQIAYATLGWLVLAPFSFAAVYFLSLPVARRVMARLGEKEAEPLGR